MHVYTYIHIYIYIYRHPERQRSVDVLEGREGDGRGASYFTLSKLLALYTNSF